MKFLRNSCQWEGNEASASVSPRGIVGLSFKLMRQCLFTVEPPLNKKGRKCIFSSSFPYPHFYLCDRCLEKNPCLSNMYTQYKDLQRVVLCESSRNTTTTKKHRSQLKWTANQVAIPKKEESHHIWDFHKVQVPRLLPKLSLACSKKALTLTASKLLWN